ncbi:MAG: hypothetical protein AAGH38_07200 [Pseudomonadota bacterium]
MWITERRADGYGQEVVAMVRRTRFVDAPTTSKQLAQPGRLNERKPGGRRASLLDKGEALNT